VGASGLCQQNPTRRRQRDNISGVRTREKIYCATDRAILVYKRTRCRDAAHRSIKELKGFERVALQPGERKTVTFDLNTHQLGSFDEALGVVVKLGTVEVMVGGPFYSVCSAWIVRPRRELCRTIGHLCSRNQVFSLLLSCPHAGR